MRGRGDVFVADMPFPPSGKRARFDFAGVFRGEDGRIAEMWIVWDNVTVLSQLGHFPG